MNGKTAVPPEGGVILSGFEPALSVMIIIRTILPRMHNCVNIAYYLNRPPLESAFILVIICQNVKVKVKAVESDIELSIVAS
jgi:hypothetical protein